MCFVREEEGCEREREREREEVEVDWFFEKEENQCSLQILTSLGKSATSLSARNSALSNRWSSRLERTRSTSEYSSSGGGAGP